MFEARRLVFYYAVSPVHMGAGSAIGAIDSPIQREVHTRHPMFAGAGIKGALRHRCQAAWAQPPRAGAAGPADAGTSLVRRIFGPDTDASEFAGALSVGDAQLVALPVRSLRGGFAYVTSPLALARLKRLAQAAGLEVSWQVPPQPEEGQALVGTDALLSGAQLVLEAFEFTAARSEPAGQIAGWLAHQAFADPQHFFARKLAADLAILSDTDLAHFAQHAMVVEPHVRIDDETGTADDGGLFYVENLPPESLMAGLAQASVERTPAGRLAGQARLEAAQVLGAVFDGTPERPGLGSAPLQIGGDATVGRGLVIVRAVAR